jgi:hypothetical protein
VGAVLTLVFTLVARGLGASALRPIDRELTVAAYGASNRLRGQEARLKGVAKNTRVDLAQFHGTV